MQRITLTLATFGVLGLAASQTQAETVRVYPAAAHLAVIGDVYHPGDVAPVGYREVAHRRYGQYRNYYSPRSYGSHYGRQRSHGAVIVQPRVYGRPTVIIPQRVHPPVYRQYYYRQPHSGFHYQGRGFSFGFSF